MYGVERKLRACVWALACLTIGCNQAATMRTIAPGVCVSSCRPVNLALSPSPSVNRMALELDRSSGWPGCDLGYRFDDVTSYAEVLFDNQVAYDRYGAVFRSGQSLRSGVLVR